jgi:hypothetical protein
MMRYRHVRARTVCARRTLSALDALDAAVSAAALAHALCCCDRDAGGAHRQVVLDIDNGSTVEMRRFTTKLVQLLTLHSSGGHVKYIRREIARQSYPGVPPLTRLTGDTARSVPLTLRHSYVPVP